VLVAESLPLPPQICELRGLVAGLGSLAQAFCDRISMHVVVLP